MVSVRSIFLIFACIATAAALQPEGNKKRQREPQTPRGGSRKRQRSQSPQPNAACAAGGADAGVVGGAAPDSVSGVESSQSNATAAPAPAAVRPLPRPLAVRVDVSGAPLAPHERHVLTHLRGMGTDQLFPCHQQVLKDLEDRESLHGGGSDGAPAQSSLSVSPQSNANTTSTGSDSNSNTTSTDSNPDADTTSTSSDSGSVSFHDVLMDIIPPDAHGFIGPRATLEEVHAGTEAFYAWRQEKQDNEPMSADDEDDDEMKPRAQASRMKMKTRSGSVHAEDGSSRSDALTCFAFPKLSFLGSSEE